MERMKIHEGAPGWEPGSTGLPPQAAPNPERS